MAGSPKVPLHLLIKSVYIILAKFYIPSFPTEEKLRPHLQRNTKHTFWQIKNHLHPAKRSCQSILPLVLAHRLLMASNLLRWDWLHRPLLLGRCRRCSILGCDGGCVCVYKLGFKLSSFKLIIKTLDSKEKVKYIKGSLDPLWSVALVLFFYSVIISVWLPASYWISLGHTTSHVRSHACLVSSIMVDVGAHSTISPI